MIKTKTDLKYYLEKDAKALLSEEVGFIQKLKDPIYRYERLLRKCEYYRNTSKVNTYINPLYLYNKIKFRKLGFLLGFSIIENYFYLGLSIAIMEV